MTLIGLAVICACLSGVGWCIGQALRSDGKVTHCYVVMTDGYTEDSWTVWGFRPWRKDIMITILKSASDAETWRATKCPK